MQSGRIKLVVAVLVAGIGAFLAFRTLYRPVPSRPDARDTRTEDPARARAVTRMESLDTTLRAPTREELPATLAAIGATTQQKTAALGADERFRPEQSRALGSAFRARLAYLLGGEFDENASDLAAIGWPMPESERYEKSRALWEQYRRDKPPAPIDVDEIEIRRVTSEMLDEHGGLRREGYGLTTMEYSIANEYFAYEGQDLVEAVIPMRTEDVTGHATTALVGFVFAWDDADGYWRPIRSVLFHADEEAGGIAPPSIF